MQPQADKKLYLKVVNLKYNEGFQSIISMLEKSNIDAQSSLAETNDPVKIIPIHAQWQAGYKLLSFLKQYPDEIRQQYIETFGIEPEVDEIVD
ncbi:hypothetical protein UFOVP434_55 [uncultured Caudovirales phage]|uniref:Uncharacterized protein n=1 Tax=uncultured Caudovirales phage TaxID=2100421 RepID=A0A6J5MB53_9CAUD|nr:hypothetical protein UFOVP434_55 [uncultured Caudovirales phage]